VNIIGELGYIKDYGITLEALTVSLHDSGMSKKKAHEEALRLMIAKYGKRNLTHDAQKLHRFIERTGLLDVIAEEIADQL
jgi:hypothetical protein